jgi:hypothetical protein
VSAPVIVPRAYSITGAIAATGLSKSHLMCAIRTGELKVKKSSRDEQGEPTGKFVILAAELDRYLEGLPDA